jgi:hypothetical protein
MPLYAASIHASNNSLIFIDSSGKLVFVSPVKSGLLAKFGLTVTVVTGVPVNP